MEGSKWAFFEVQRLDSNKHEGQTRLSKVLCWAERRNSSGSLCKEDYGCSVQKEELFKTLPEWTFIVLASVFYNISLLSEKTNLSLIKIFYHEIFRYTKYI